MRLLIVCLLALGLLTGCDRQSGSGPQGGAPAVQAGEVDRSRAGTAAPDASFQDPQGRPVTLEAFRGKPVLVNLWATWCAPCIVEMPSLDRLAQRDGSRLTVLTLSQDLEGRQKVTDFFREHRYKAIQPYLDQNMAFMTALGIGTLPTTILYDAEGREVWRKAGIEDWTGEKAAGLIAEASR